MAYKPSPKTATPADTALQYSSRESLGTVCDCMCACLCAEELVWVVRFDGLLGSDCSLCVLYLFGK